MRQRVLVSTLLEILGRSVVLQRGLRRETHVSTLLEILASSIANFTSWRFEFWFQPFLRF